MLVTPKFRGFICTTAHPTGCAANIKAQVNFIEQQPKFDGPKRVLVVGSSAGYGLASRIALTFGSGADTIGVCFERPASDKRTATAGWYNTAAFEEIANARGYKAYTINGDAFSNEIKDEAVSMIKDKLGQIDCLVYSLASPKRLHPVTGELYSSVLKPLNSHYVSKTVDFHNQEVSNVSISPATGEETQATVAVMGGEDWQMWVNALREADVVSQGFTTVAYSYIGPGLTYPIYRDGTVGKAKDHLEMTARNMNRELHDAVGGRAVVSVNKAVVTQSSAAIPVVPLYISILFKVMRENDIHEDCIEQMYRLFSEHLYTNQAPPEMDKQGRIRVDDLEMRDEVQKEVARCWMGINSENINQISDIEEYRTQFFRLFGFDVPGVNYDEDVDLDVKIPSLSNA